MLETRHHASLLHARHMSLLGRLNWAHTIRGIAMCSISVFVPIYLYKIGYHLPDVAWYFALTGFFWVLFLYPALRFIRRYGPQKGMTMATLLTIAYAGVLLTFQSWHWPLWALALAWGAMTAPYWLSYRVAFSEGVHGARAGREISVSASLSIAASGVAPLLSGVVATFFGIQYVYFFALGLCILALGSLIEASANETVEKSVHEQINLREIAPDLWANAAYSVDDLIAGFIWPLLVYFFIKSYAGVGALASVVVVSSILVSLYVGRHEQRRGEKHYIREGSLLMTGLQAGRALASSASHVFGINLLSGISHALIDTPYYSKYYRRATETSRLGYLYAMQMASAVSTLLFGLVIWTLSLYLSSSLTFLAALLIAIPAPYLILRFANKK